MSNYPSTTEVTTWMLSQGTPPTPWMPTTLACTVYAPDGTTVAPSVSAAPSLSTSTANAYQAIWTATMPGDWVPTLVATDANGYTLTIPQVKRIEALPLPSGYPGG